MSGVFKNILLLLVSIVVSFGVLEAGSRFIFPVQYGHSFITMDGTADITLSQDLLALTPSITFRQKTHEYDKVTTHTAAGFRGPMTPDNPDIIFIGDSFTYGTGLSDEETFAYLYCRETGKECANLGRIGSGTVRQIDILEHFMAQESWRPREIKLVMLAMTSALMAGNDLMDNIGESRWKYQ